MNVEMVAVKIPERKIVILGVYRRPSRDFKCFMDKLTDVLQELSAFEKFNVILTKDFNVDFIEESDHRNQLLNLIESFGLHITTIETSRVTQFSATCINVITDLSSELSVTVTEELNFSDHRSQSFIC
ncbi:hypothetical protein HHI36_004177 [Cryptolaemus montrouzieri]|uniref:Endonuclease/exonuclease/phosphatase domain-containing protein n=1 Tax=Cryptolaemus montrouzieri TaxID=559131 RepID=A0ABD2NQG0_9CUCU